MLLKPFKQKAQLAEREVQHSKERLRLFVPVDFSSSSFNTLQYAMQIAKMCGGTIYLFHAMGIEDIPNSESPLSIQFELKKAETAAYAKLNSLKEIATEFGTTVSSCYVAMGDPLSSLKLRLSLCGSNLLVLSKSEKISHWTDLKLPMLSVPAMVMPKPPARVLMIRDGEPVQERSLQPLLEILNYGKRQVTVIDCGPNDRKLQFNYWLQLGNTKVDFTHKYELVRATEKEIKRVVAKYTPDLICRAQKHKTWWEKLWSRAASPEVDFDIPTLVLQIK